MENTAIIAMSSKDAYRAQVINNRIDNPFLTGVLIAKIAELKARMANGVVEIWYSKKNGEIRHAFATTFGKLVKDHINGRGLDGDARRVVTYWDIEKGAFRCFQMQALIKMK